MRLFLICALLAAPVHADVCSDLGDYAESLALSRDHGVPLSSSIRVIDSNHMDPEIAAVLKRIAITVYGSLNSPVSIRRDIEIGCYEGWMGQPVRPRT